VEADWPVGLIKFLDALSKLPNTSPEGGVRPGRGTMANGRSEGTGPSDLEESLGGGDGVVGHGGISGGSLKWGR